MCGTGAVREQVAHGTTGAPAVSFRFRTLGFPSGFGLRTWLRLLEENDFAVDPVHGPKVALVTLQAIYNSLAARLEHRRYGAEVASTEIQPPLFVIGHWRSGTTYLHQLLTCDENFAYPNTFQCLHPHGFLLDEDAIAPEAQRFFPKLRPTDSTPLSVRSPQEDEFAIMYLSGLSPMTGWIFPRNQERYDRLMTLRGATVRELARWKAAINWFLKKLSWKYHKPLILKSPSHTGRIRTLLELFPRARFVHIHRNPYDVFQSTKHMLTILQQILRIQSVSPLDDAEKILGTYAELYDAFFEDRRLIPEQQFAEVCFEDLERDPRGTVEQIYRKLSLPGFDAMEPRLCEHVASLGTYQKNPTAPLEPELQQRIAAQWRRGFNAWGYAV